MTHSAGRLPNDEQEEQHVTLPNDNIQEDFDVERNEDGGIDSHSGMRKRPIQEVDIFFALLVNYLEQVD